MLINSSFAYSSTNAPLRRSGNAFKAGIQVLIATFKQGQKKHLDPWYKHSGMTSKKIKQKMITN